MPYSDNMYSMNDDSDGEDYASHLSPTDGYFPASSNVTPRIPNIFVPDPTLEQRTETGAESKAREADEERLLSSQTDSRSRHSESSFARPSGRLGQATTSTSASSLHHHHSVTYSQSSAPQTSSPVFSNRAQSTSVYADAPPAYSPSPISPISSQSTSQQGHARNYNTFGNSDIMGAPGVENERLLGSQPESMGAPVDEECDTPAWASQVRRRIPAWLSWKYALLALVVLIVSVAFLAGLSSSHSTKGGNDTITRPTMPVDKEPQEQVPDDSNNPDESESPFQPTYCEGEQHRYNDQILSLDFERSRNITFEETGQSHSGSIGVRVGGQIIIRRLKEGGDPRMVLEIATNEPDLRLHTSLDADLQAIRVNVPDRYENTVPGQHPCVEMRGTVWVPENAEIGILSIRAIHLDVLLLDDLSLRVVDYSELSSVVGDIRSGASKPASYKNSNAVFSDPGHAFVPAKDSYVFDSRVIEVSTTSGKIEGNWPLYDVLGLHTTSGNVQVSITPEEELADNPKPAVLSLSTISGAISAAEPDERRRIPQRDYLVDIKSTAGSVRGALAFGAGITVHSTSSDVTLDLLPVINIDEITPEKPAQLETVTTSGATAVRIVEPILFDGNGKTISAGTFEDGVLVDLTSRALDCLEATHRSTSGNIGLRYPQSWEGTLYAVTTSGQLIAKGKDLKIIKYAGGWPGSKMEARKGPVGKKSTIQVHALLGTMDTIIGDEH
ncbi:hypothetical protein HD806DRAFT_541076 [Xylariaceae sp. AK1471]|nr:hypothetical protein HD806DRAFT_541076 [Xylariaceae sp. AK1471]